MQVIGQRIIRFFDVGIFRANCTRKTLESSTTIIPVNARALLKWAHDKVFHVLAILYQELSNKYIINIVSYSYLGF